MIDSAGLARSGETAPSCALVWDLSGVLIEDVGQPPSQILKFTELDAQDWNTIFIQFVDSAENWSKVERGELRLEEFATELAAAIEAAGGFVCHKHHLEFIWWGGEEPIERRLDATLDRFITASSMTHPHYIATNNVKEYASYWKPLVSRLPVVRAFDSSDLGCRKPEYRFFSLVEESVLRDWPSLSPQELILIDDNSGNCAAAIDHGWRAVHFTSADRCLAELSSLGLDTTGAQSEE